MDILKKLAAESDKLLDEAIEKMKADGASDWNADLVNKVYRPYAHMLEAANVAGMEVGPVSDAIANMIANIIHAFAARVTQRNDMADAVVLVQNMMKVMADQLSATIAADWVDGSSAETH